MRFRVSSAPRNENRWLLFGLGLGVMMGALDGAVIATVLPIIAKDLNGVDHLSWIASSFLFGTALASPAWGVLGDSWGHRRVVRLGLWLLLLATFLCATAGAVGANNMIFNGSFQLAVYRLLQGIASAAVFSGTFSLLPELFGARRRARSTGKFSLMFAIATMFGPVLGGLIGDGLHAEIMGVSIAGWRFVFILQLPILVVALSLIDAKPIERPHTVAQFDFKGLSLIGVFLAASIMALDYVRSEHAYGVAILLAIIAILALSALWMVERRAVNPVLSPQLLSIMPIRQSCWIGGTCSAALLCFSISFPANLQLFEGLSATSTGTIMVSFSFGIAAGAMVGGRTIGHTGAIRSVTIAAIILCLLALGALSGTSSVTPTWLAVIVFVIGVGFGPLQSAFMISAQNAAPPARQGATSGLVQFSRRVGATIGAGATSLLITQDRPAPNFPVSPESVPIIFQYADYPHLLPSALCAGFLLLALGFAFNLPREKL